MWKSGVVFMLMLILDGVIATPPPLLILRTSSAFSAAAPPSVQITRSWSPPHKTQYAEGCLGTVIGPGLILTHNHFSKPGAAHLSEIVTFSDPDGHQTMVPSTQIQIIRLKGDITLLHLPVDVACRAAFESTRLGAFGHVPTSSPCPQAQPATPEVITRLRRGDRLAVNYRDKTTKQLVQNDFEVRSVQDGVVTLSDPQQAIGAGDSGGGVYANGQLVGNISSINCYLSGSAAGSFNVTLLPVEIMDLSGAP